MRTLLDSPRLIVATMGVAVASILLFLLGMDPSVRQAAADRLGYGGPHVDEAGDGRDLFHSGVPIAGTKSGMTYTVYDARRDTSQSQAFSGFGCVHTCKRHEEGYRWAAGRQIATPQECNGSTWEFVEGCAAFALGRGVEAQGN